MAESIMQVTPPGAQCDAYVNSTRAEVSWPRVSTPGRVCRSARLVHGLITSVVLQVLVSAAVVRCDADRGVQSATAMKLSSAETDAFAGLPSFPVPTVPHADASSAIFVRIPGAWNHSSPLSKGLCAAIVRSPEDCRADRLPSFENCTARVLRDVSVHEHFLGLALERPAFATGSDAPLSGHLDGHAVCLWVRDGHGRLDLEHLRSTLGPRSPRGAAWESNPALLGGLSYYPLPRVHVSHTIEHVGVRTFLNPGWHRELSVQCTNCSAANRLAIRPLYMETHCEAIRGPVAAAVMALRGEQQLLTGLQVPTAAQSELKFGPGGLTLPWPRGLLCDPPKQGPCHGYADDAFDVALPLDADKSSALAQVFLLQSDRRLPTKERRRLFHHRSVVCFYPDESAPQGWLVGFLEFHMDSHDVQAFVIFVCFFGLALPLICMVTVLLHANKQQRCKVHVREMQLQQQRQQLERELEERVALANAGRGDEGGGPLAGIRPQQASGVNATASASAEQVAPPRAPVRPPRARSRGVASPESFGDDARRAAASQRNSRLARAAALQAMAMMVQSPAWRPMAPGTPAWSWPSRIRLASPGADPMSDDEIIL